MLSLIIVILTTFVRNLIMFQPIWYSDLLIGHVLAAFIVSRENVDTKDSLDENAKFSEIFPLNSYHVSI